MGMIDVSASQCHFCIRGIVALEMFKVPVPLGATFSQGTSFSILQEKQR